jgi:hypothetical protein
MIVLKKKAATAVTRCNKAMQYNNHARHFLIASLPRPSPSYLEEWGELLLSLALLVAPWTVGCESVSATVSSVVSGLLVILFAAWELMTDRDSINRWHDRAPPDRLMT